MRLLPLLVCSSCIRPRATTMCLERISLHFDFNRIPFAAGIQHIHSPEYFAGTHNIGPLLFELESVGEPQCTPSKTSITFNCSTLFAKHMCVRMFSRQPNESNLLFFKDGRAVYTLKFTVSPTKAFTAHRLQMDLNFHADFHRPTAKSLLPIFMFLSSLDNDYQPLVHENANLTQYRRAVLRGRGSSEFWIMAERVIREYNA